MKCLKILFIKREWNRWRDSRFWSYGAHVGLAEGLRDIGIDCTIVNDDWLPRVAKHLYSKNFDQVWIDDLVHIRQNESWYEQISKLSPIRVGFIVESLEYEPHEWNHNEELEFKRKQDVLTRAKHVTHIVACDEKDVRFLNNEKIAPAMWGPFSVPQWAIDNVLKHSGHSAAIFSGSLYGERLRWLQETQACSMIKKLDSKEDNSIWPYLYDTIQNVNRFYLHKHGGERSNIIYNNIISNCRKRCFQIYLEGLKNGCAIVNFPHFVKTYSPRVVESMALGRPVISWDIPDRPRNKKLFQEEHDILLYPKEGLDVLTVHINRLKKDRILAENLVRNAQKKVIAFHTTAKRASQIIEWIENGTEPQYE